MVEGDIEGVDQVRIDQVQKGKVVKVGLYPIAQHLYAEIIRGGTNLKFVPLTEP